MAKPKRDERQISVRLPTKVYDDLRTNGYELHKSHTAIITEALILYNDLAQRKKAAKMPAKAVAE